MSPITPVSPPQGRRRSEGGQWRARGGAGRALGPAARGPREARARGPEPQGGRRARAARAQAAATQGASHVRTPPPRAHALTHSSPVIHVLFIASVRCAERPARVTLTAPARALARPASAARPVHVRSGDPRTLRRTWIVRTRIVTVS